LRLALVCSLESLFCALPLDNKRIAGANRTTNAITINQFRLDTPSLGVELGRFTFYSSVARETRRLLQVKWARTSTNGQEDSGNLPFFAARLVIKICVLLRGPVRPGPGKPFVLLNATDFYRCLFAATSGFNDQAHVRCAPESVKALIVEFAKCRRLIFIAIDIR
jgi:hypothetical protein